MLTRKEYYKLLIFCVVLVILITIQYFISDALQQVSIPIIKLLQTDNYLVKAMQYVSELGSKQLNSLFLIYVFCFCNVYHSFIYIIVYYNSLLFCAWLKIIMQQPRPFWIDSSITAFDCESGYGYPSNHVLSSVPSFFIFFEILYYHYEVDRTVNAKSFYWIGIIISTILCVSLGFSRMVLGVHSLDQVFFGLVTGFAIYYFFLHIIDYDIRNFHPFLQKISNPFQCAKIFFMFILCYVIFIINIMFVNIHYEPIWTVRILKNCGELPPLTPFYKCIVESGEYFFIFGALLGIMYDVQINYLSKSKNNKLSTEFIIENITDNLLSHPKAEHRTGKWNDTSPVVSVLRFIVLYLIFMFVFYFFEHVFTLFQENLLTLYIVMKMLPCICSAFVIFSFGKNISYLLSLSNPTEDGFKK